MLSLLVSTTLPRFVFFSLALRPLPRKLGTFVEIGHRILAEKIAHEKKGKMSFQYDDFYFHYHANNGLIVLCLADKSFPRRIAFAFLEKMSESFVDTFGMETIQSADAFGKFSHLVFSVISWGRFGGGGSGWRVCCFLF